MSDLVFDPRARSAWTSDTQARRRKFRRMISLSHHATFMLGKFFPKSIPLIYVVGYPKSGTTWVCQLVADYLQLPFPQHAILPVGFPAVVHGHETVSRRFPQGVYVVRDGRDVVVSAYHHLRNQAKNGGGAKVYRKFFEARETGDTVKSHMASFIRLSFQHPIATGLNWGRHVQVSGASRNEHFPQVRYEDLQNDTRSALAKLIEELTDNPADQQRVNDTVARFDFNKQAGRSQGQESQTSYLRKGQTGDWVNHFDHNAAAVFHEHFGKSLIAAGYEVDSSWVDCVN